VAVPVDALWIALLFIGLAAGGTSLDRKLRAGAASASRLA